MTKPLCIYHGNCADGFGAAWAVRRALGADNVDFYAGVYQKPPPDVTGRKVIIVDFSYKRPVLEEMAAQAQSILVLDHHKTAAEDLAGFAEVPGPHPDYPEMRGWLPDSRVHVQFDMRRSGATMAWDHFIGGRRPRLIEHIEDRDLWRFKLPGTREIQASVFSFPYDFAVWDELVLERNPESLLAEGRAIERKHHKDIAELLGVTTRTFKIKAPHPVGGSIELAIELANLPYTLASDAGHELAKRSPYGIGGCYWDTPEGRVFSLRATETGMDVSAIAKLYGGGGHKAASGFRVPFDQLGQFDLYGKDTP